MSLYPKKIKKFQNPDGVIGSDTTSTTSMKGQRIGKVSNGIGTGLEVASAVAVPLIDQAPRNEFGEGIQVESMGAAVGKGALKGAAAGAAMGSVAGPWGTIIGAGVGATVGTITSVTKNNKQQKEATAQERSIRESRGLAAQNIANNNWSNTMNFYKQQRSLIPTNYRTYSAKKGGTIYPKFQMGGTTPHAVIPKGTLHSEKNNIGSKGLPVIAKNGEKIAEVERDEIIFTKEQTNQIEKLYHECLQNHIPEIYLQLGQLVSNFVETSKK